MKTFLLISFFTVSAFALGPRPCSLEWAKDGAVSGPNSIWGLGLSTNKDPIQAKDEARAKAYSDIALQLKSSVQTSMNLTETDKSTAYSGLSSVENKMEGITGMKVTKEGSDQDADVSYCVAVKLDVRAAYEIPQGKMKALEANTAAVSDALDKKKFLDVLKLASAARKDVASAKDDIALADVYKAFLKEQGSTWNEKFATLLGKITDAETNAKQNVVFILPAGQYDDAFIDIESMLSSQGFSVVNKTGDVEKGKLSVSIEIKTIGTVRKSKTALGETAIAKISIAMKDGQTKKNLAANKGADVVGTGATDEDAMANVSRQLSTQIVGVINDGLPGIIKQE